MAIKKKKVKVHSESKIHKFFLDRWIEGWRGGWIIWYVNAERAWFGSVLHEIPEIWFCFYSLKSDYSVKLVTQIPKSRESYDVPKTAGLSWDIKMNTVHSLQEIYILDRETRLIIRQPGGQMMYVGMSGSNLQMWKRWNGMAWWLYVAYATLWDLEWKGQHSQVRGEGKELIAGRVEGWGNYRTRELAELCLRVSSRLLWVEKPSFLSSHKWDMPGGSAFAWPLCCVIADFCRDLWDLLNVLAVKSFTFLI